MRNLITVSLCAVFVAALLVSTGCEDTPLVAGTGSTMSLSFTPPDPSFASTPVPDSISSQVTAVILSSDGIPQSGISVSFSATGGAMDSNGEFRDTNSHGVATDTVRVTHAAAGAEINVTARSGAVTKSVTIPTELCTGNQPPVAHISPSTPQTLAVGVQGTTVSAAPLSGSDSTDPEETALTYTWTCFDGAAPSDGPDVTCQYTYEAALRTYTIRLVVKDSGLAGSPECALSSSAAAVTVTVPAGTAPPAL